MTDKRIEDLEKRIKTLEESKSVSEKPKKKEKKPRKPSAYNEFIGKEIKEIKKNDKEITHKEAFSKAVKAWNAKKKESSE